jgi:hypothetical protein
MATNKIAHNSPSHASPSELETNIAQALFDLEISVSDLKAALRPLQFYAAKEVRYNIISPASQRSREDCRPSLPFYKFVRRKVRVS